VIDLPSSAADSNDTLTLSIGYNSEGFALVAIENRGDEPVTLTVIGVWLPGAAMGWDFRPSRVCKAHPYPGLPFELAPGDTVIFPVNLGDMYVKLIEKQSEVRDFVYFATNGRARDFYSRPVAVQSFLRAIDDTPHGAPHLLHDESIFQA